MKRDRPAISKEDAIDKLAQTLHFEMERMDPTEDPEWGAMDEFSRDFYRLCVRSLLDKTDLIQIALQSAHSDSPQ